MKRVLVLLYGIAAYAVALGSLVYAIGFVSNLVVPKSIDIGGVAPWPQALLIDLGLLTMFAVQHSVMARQGFKRWSSRFVPKPVERSTYVLAAALIMIALFWFWVPIPVPVWRLEPSTAYAVLAISLIGWGLVVGSTFLIDHFNLFGVSQVFAAWRGRTVAEPEFRIPFFYKLVRHPIYLGFLLAFWAAPTMTVGHLVFALATSGYILIGIMLEERDLIAAHGDAYRTYRQRVRMLLPLPSGRS
jgi:methanethiol S-methyltransferase